MAEGRDRRDFLRGYVRPDHPVMREVTAALQAATGFDLSRTAVGTDGCSIPAYAIPLRAWRTPSPGSAPASASAPGTPARQSACAQRWHGRRSWSPAAAAWTRG